jgi:hypothetical protein
VTVEILQSDRLAKPYELVVDEAILDVVELVDVLHNCLTLIFYKVLDKSICADGNTKANVAVHYKGRGREQGTEVREGGIGIEHTMCGSVRISRRDTRSSLQTVSILSPSLSPHALSQDALPRRTSRISWRHSALSNLISTSGLNAAYMAERILAQ